MTARIRVSQHCVPRTRLATILLTCVAVNSVLASTFDNESGNYQLSALPDAASEARRMDRMQLDDQQPAGRYLRKGETITLAVDELARGAVLDVAIGFPPMWSVKLDQQIGRMRAGDNSRP